MSNIKANISNCSALIKDFDKSVSNYNNAVDSFFKSVKQYKGWEGDAAQKYLGGMIEESVSYIDFGTSLQSYSNILSEVLVNLENTVKASAKH